MTADFPPVSYALLTGIVERLRCEVAELRQLVGALTLVVSDDLDPEFVESYELIVGWALEEFDPEMLRECLAHYDLPPAPVMPHRVQETTLANPPPSHSQKQLFSHEEPHDEGANG
jgi:hypothetical protein